MYLWELAGVCVFLNGVYLLKVEGAGEVVGISLPKAAGIIGRVFSGTTWAVMIERQRA